MHGICLFFSVITFYKNFEKTTTNYKLMYVYGYAQYLQYSYFNATKRYSCCICYIIFLSVMTLLTWKYFYVYDFFKSCTSYYFERLVDITISNVVIFFFLPLSYYIIILFVFQCRNIHVICHNIYLLLLIYYIL